MKLHLTQVKLNSSQKSGFYKSNLFNEIFFVSSRKKLKDKHHLTALGVLEKPRKNTNPGHFNMTSYLALYDSEYQFNITEIVSEVKADRLRFSVLSYIDKISNDKFVLLNAFIKSSVFGDKSDLTTKQKDLIRKSGLSHFFALSGLHVGFILLIVWTLLSQITKSLKLRVIIVVVILTLYMIISEISPSLFRASLMALMIVISRYKEIYISSKRILLLSMLINIFIFPFDIFKLSFWLSYNAMFAIVFGMDFIKAYFCEVFYSKSRTAIFIKSLTALLMPYFGTMPLALYLFGETSLIGPATNLLLLPILVLVLYGSLLFLFISLLHYEFSTMIASFLEFVLNCFYYLISYFDDIQMLKVKGYFLEFILIFILLTAIIQFRKYKTRINYIIIISTLSLFALIKYQIKFKWLQIHQFDLGQAQSILIQKGDYYLLYDAGREIRYRLSEKNEIKLILNHLSIDSLSQIIISHKDYDHYGNLKGLNYRNLIFEEPNKLIEHPDILVKYLSSSIITTNKNDASKVILLHFGKIKMLFTGDISIRIEDVLVRSYGNLLESTILQVAHHGSESSSSKAFIKQVNPKISLISVGQNNNYGHPANAVLKRLNKSVINRTDINSYSHYISNGENVFLLPHWFHLIITS